MCERECVYMCVCEEETDLILVSGCVHLNVQTYYNYKERSKRWMCTYVSLLHVCIFTAAISPCMTSYVYMYRYTV